MLNSNALRLAVVTYHPISLAVSMDHSRFSDIRHSSFLEYVLSYELRHTYKLNFVSKSIVIGSCVI